MELPDDLKREIKIIRNHYQELRDDPGTPQGLTSCGQSGSLLDYQEADRVGKLICSRVGHASSFLKTGFCTRCGERC